MRFTQVWTSLIDNTIYDHHRQSHSERRHFFGDRKPFWLESKNEILLITKVLEVHLRTKQANNIQNLE